MTAILLLASVFLAPPSVDPPKRITWTFEERLSDVERRLTALETAPAVALPQPAAFVPVQFTAGAEAPVCANGRCSTSSRTTSTYQQSTGSSGPIRRLFGR